MKQAIEILRWLAVLPAAVAAWWVAVTVTILGHVLVTAACPERYEVSGACVAPWMPTLTRVSTFVGASLAAVLVVLAASYTAPAHRRHVAQAAYVVGLAVALYMANETEGWLELGGAVVAGWLCVRAVRKRAGPSPPVLASTR